MLMIAQLGWEWPEGKSGATFGSNGRVRQGERR